VSEPTIDSAQGPAAPRPSGPGTRRAAERARLREDFDALMATLHHAESDLRAGRLAPAEAGGVPWHAEQRDLPAGPLSRGDAGGVPRAPRGGADRPGGPRSIDRRRGAVEVVDRVAPTPAGQSSPEVRSAGAVERAAGVGSSAAVGSSATVGSPAVVQSRTPVLGSERSGPAGATPAAHAEPPPGASLAVRRWDDRLDQRRREAARHAAALEEVQLRLARALRRLGSEAQDPGETADAGAHPATAGAPAERVPGDRGILTLISNARAALHQACDELACRSRRIHETEGADGDQRSRRASLEHSLAALEQDSVRLRSALGLESAAASGPSRSTGDHAAAGSR
jgi:hypothetical protein